MENKEEKIFLFREYIITEYKIKANSMEQAKKRLYGEYCEQWAEWKEKTTLRIKPKNYNPYKN